MRIINNGNNPTFYTSSAEQNFQDALFQDNLREAFTIFKNNQDLIFPYISIQEQARLFEWAVLNETLEDVQLLLPPEDRQEQRIALFEAVQNNDMQGNTILHKASFRAGNSIVTTQILDLLIDAGAQINAINANNQTPLGAIIEYQLTPGEELEGGDIEDYDGIEIALYFLNNYEDVIPTLNPREASQSLIWILSEDHGDLENKIPKANQLIALGADVNMIDVEGEPVITKTLRDRRPHETIWLLIQANIDLTPLNPEQIEELAFDVCFYWDVELLGGVVEAQRALERLIGRGLDLQATDQGHNLLAKAVIGKSRDVVLAILNSPMINIDPSGIDEQYNTSLNYAIREGSVEIFQILRNNRVRFNIQHSASDIFEKVLNTFDSEYLEIYKNLYFSLQGQEKAIFNQTILRKIGELQNNLRNQEGEVLPSTHEKLQFFYRSLTPFLNAEQLNEMFSFFNVNNTLDLFSRINASPQFFNEEQFNALTTPLNEGALDQLIDQQREINQQLFEAWRRDVQEVVHNLNLA
ncbi:MAG: ankyrin repeat domain-containing protein [Chlamydiota bacterium]|jgi:ankyrin repeat protein